MKTIRKTFNAANEDENCAGVIAWMHMFSPAKSWMLGLKDLRKPLLHLHTQFKRRDSVRYTGYGLYQYQSVSSW